MHKYVVNDISKDIENLRFQECSNPNKRIWIALLLKFARHASMSSKKRNKRDVNIQK